MADEQMTRSAAITEWLAQLGYPAASLQTPMQPHIERWWGYLSREASFYTRRERLQNGRMAEVRVRSCSPADMVDTDMAALMQRTRGDRRSR